MTIRRLLAAGLGVILAASVAGLSEPARAAAEPVTVAVIDTGIDPFHPEFDFRGPASTDDQIVGWWDFSDDADGHLPKPGQLWDPILRMPYDPHGHGTATASMAVGLNAAPEKNESAYPGGKLAMAKVGSGEKGDVISGDIAEAIYWAVETVGAEVISMSIGAGLPGLSSGTIGRALAEAREAGVLVVVSNGNGFLNAGIPGEPGMIKGFGDSPAVLSVGAAGASGVQATTDPEVVADWSPVAASRGGEYRRTTGTSFSAPFVAGFAARLLHEAWAADRDMEPSALEDLVKFSARDTALPPTYEGYGVIDLELLDEAIAHARAGTMPAPNLVNHTWSTLVRDTATGLLEN